MSETVFRKEYQQLRERYSSYFETYTDGSKCEQKVAAGTFYPKEPENSGAVRLRDGSSVFNTELEGILLALKNFSTLTKTNKKFIIYTDSFSAVEILGGKNLSIQKHQRFLQPLQKLPPQIQITIAWTPSHVSIIGHERADKLLKTVLSSRVAPFSRLCWSDLKSKVNNIMYIGTIWQEL